MRVYYGVVWLVLSYAVLSFNDIMDFTHRQNAMQWGIHSVLT